MLADEGGVWFLGGGYQELVGMLPALDRIEAAFREGGGVPQAAYSEDAYTGMARLTQAWFDHHLTGSWLPLLPDVQQRLRDGISWADVGCGVGWALIRLAHEYPRSTFVGYDAFAAQVERARREADGAGVGDRVRFEVADGSRGLPERYDVIRVRRRARLTDPAGLVAGIRRSLTDGGTYVMLEMNCADDPADNSGPIATLLYGSTSCMTTSRCRPRDLRLPAGRGAGAGARWRVSVGPGAADRRSVQPALELKGYCRGRAASAPRTCRPRRSARSRGRAASARSGSA